VEGGGEGKKKGKKKGEGVPRLNEEDSITIIRGKGERGEGGSSIRSIPDRSLPDSETKRKGGKGGGNKGKEKGERDCES